MTQSMSTEYMDSTDLWRGQSPNQIRWIPYIYAGGDGRATSGETSSSVALTGDVSVPAEILRLAAPSYNERLSNAGGSPMDPDLAFLRNRTILFVGDSHDRKNVEGFCAHHADLHAQLLGRGGHLATRCVIPALNLTLANWFHHGMAEGSESWYGDSLSPQMDVAPYDIEARLPAQFEADIADIGTPDLVILNSVYWDLRYFTRKAVHEGWSEQLRKEPRTLTWDELRWHRHRLQVFVELFRKRFPDTPHMYRPAQLRATNKGAGNVAIFQINESAKSLMETLGVPIFPWGDLLIGEEDYADDMHVNILSQATYLHADMAMYYLKRAVAGG
ncbi:hypothetical protein JCM10908_006998 [Rhodotorula pacifica]|uniref:uncharacterized protein n=1 Tax=Rhodotorula pacifica TaxID=1495444 RepID=UPI00316B4C0E